MLAADSSSSSPAGLKLMVDLSSYQLPQISSLPPSSPASPPEISRHPKTANLVASAAANPASTRVLHSPSSEPLAFSDAGRYAV